jgi:hypothetical protein
VHKQRSTVPFRRTHAGGADRRLAAAHARYTATVDLHVECLCLSLKLDTVTVSHRLKPDDLDDVVTEVEILGQPSSGKFGLGLRIENSCLTMTQYAAGDRIPQDRQASEPGHYSRNIKDELGSSA